MSENRSHKTPLAVGDQLLIRRIGWFEASLFNIGQIIGTGIFTNPATILSNAGSTGAALLLWLLGALAALSGLWGFTELGTTFPRSGGEKEYLKQIYLKPRLLVETLFTISAGVVLKGAGLANALIAFGSYINFSIYGPTFSSDYGSRGWAFGAITILSIITIFSGKIAVKFNSTITVYKLLLLTFLVFTGIVALAGGFKDVSIPGLNSSTINFQGTTNTGNVATAIYSVMFAYNGWANVNYILDEVHDPIRNLPKAAVFSLSTTFVLYLLANFAYFGVLTRAEISGSSLTIAATFFSKLYGGSFGSRVLPFLIALSPLGLATTLLYTSSRILLEAARDGLLPFADYIGWVEPRTNSPVFSIALLWLLTSIFLWAPPPGNVFNFIVSFASYTGYLFYLLAVAGIYLLRRREPELERPIKLPLFFGIFFIFFSLYELIFVFVPPVKNTTVYAYYLPYVGAVILLVLSVGYWYLQVVVYKGPEKSYNARIIREAEAAGPSDENGIANGQEKVSEIKEV
ncbi:hypothetical protein HK100_010740 [Physocladia obscura]|uniref:Amino acid transporter n=1 Tax=Physocladia obscura TaxID=109957 RepID=A0AAD5T238_9FUNG|nr:hypothetical protein HK100_010740 [Physocladia obscura]